MERRLSTADRGAPGCARKAGPCSPRPPNSSAEPVQMHPVPAQGSRDEMAAAQVWEQGGAPLSKDDAQSRHQVPLL